MYVAQVLNERKLPERTFDLGRIFMVLLDSISLDGRDSTI